jgi:hypothetical protein
MDHYDAYSLLGQVTEIMKDICDGIPMPSSKVGDIINDFVRDESQGRSVCALEWLSPPVVSHDYTEDQLADLYNEIQKDAHNEGVHIHDLAEYLVDMRNWAQEDHL